jgi:hypothetical protein
MCHNVQMDPRMGMLICLSQLEVGSLLFSWQLKGGQAVGIFDLWANNCGEQS